MYSSSYPSGKSRIAVIVASFVALVVIPGGIIYWESLQPGGGTIVATVNGSPIFEQDLAFARQEMGGALQQLDEPDARNTLVDFLIERRVLALEGRAEWLGRDPEVQRRLAYYEEKAIRDVYYARKVNEAVTAESIQAFYDEKVATMELMEEIRARHILLDTKSDAKRIYRAIKGGADFAEMAQQNSVGPSAPDGGDIGFFTQSEVVESFGTAAFAMAPGEISEPVQSDFGWHIIKVEERRTQPPLSLEKVETQIQGIREYEVGQELIQQLKQAADIQIVSEESAETESEKVARPSHEAVPPTE